MQSRLGSLRWALQELVAQALGRPLCPQRFNLMQDFSQARAEAWIFLQGFDPKPVDQLRQN